MKKISIILLCSLLLVCFSGCSISNTNASGEKSNDEINSKPNDNVNEIASGNENSGDEIASGNENSGDEIASGNENSGDEIELNDVFEIIRSDTDTKAKLGFSVEYEQIYYELKNSGQYDNSNWVESSFIVTVNCTYDEATDEDWYKQCTEKDTKSLNAAFYNHYSAGISGGKYSNISYVPGMHLIYTSLEDFNRDYVTIKALADLDYVTQVYIVYSFGLPRDYMIE